jgi:hypothetical protein
MAAQKRTVYAYLRTSYGMKVETYAVCLKGLEGPDVYDIVAGASYSTHIESITVYAGVTWHHEFTLNNDGTWTAVRQVTSKDATPSKNFTKAVERWFRRNYVAG